MKPMYSSFIPSTTLVGAVLLAAVAFWAGGYSAEHQGPAALTPAAAFASPTPGLAPGATGGFAPIAKAVTPAVVNITVPRTVSDRGPRDRMEEFFGGPEERHGHGGHRGGVGSGVIVTPDGSIVTNNHVVDGAREVTVTLPDKREFTGTVVGIDPKTDLAVVKIEARDLPFVPWGDSSTLQVGEYVLAVGNPFGLNSTVTLGIVSGLGRGHMGITQYEDFIQTDAAINPGNSGGALIDTAGRLVGINTAILSQNGGFQGVGFAVPATMAKPVVESLLATGKVVRGYLGVNIQEVTPDIAKSFDLASAKGALVSDVAEDSPAERAGLTQGDVIVGYQGKAVEDGAALQRLVTGTPVGSKATITVVRQGKEIQVPVTVGEQPGAVKVARADGEATQVLAGLDVQPLDARAARALGIDPKLTGVVVAAVEPDSAADRAGLQPGDVIREIDRHPIASVKDFEKAAAQIKKDRRTLLLINRRGASLYLSVNV